MNNFEKWYELFKKGWETRVIENEHLCKICFLEFISTINKVRYVYGGQYKSVNLSSFKIQQSGTGKGVGDGYVHDLLSRLGYNVCKINNFTESGVIGSIHVDNSGKITSIPGALGIYDFIWIDEGRNLIIGNNWTQGLLEVINGYLDDGRIFKRLAKGNIEYHSNCNFATGSFFFDKLKPAIFATGFFQRCLFTYKYYSHDDIIRISKKFDNLADKSFSNDLKPVINDFHSLIRELNFNKYFKGNNKFVINMKLDSSKKFGEIIDKYFQEEIINQLADKRLKDIMLSFLIRSKQLGHKVMCLYSVWNEKDFIDDDSIEYASEIVKNQLKYTLEFMGDIFEDTKFDSEDLGKEMIKQKKKTLCERVVIEVIRENPGMTKGEFRKYIQNNRIRFLLGELNIIRNILPNLIINKQITEESGESSAEKKLFISDKL